MSELTVPDGWHVVEGMLRRTVVLKDFLASLDLIQRIAPLAEAAGHHPDLDIRYNKVHIALVTHDAGNSITEKDLALADQINGLL